MSVISKYVYVSYGWVLQDVVYVTICLRKHCFYQSEDARHAFKDIAVSSGRGTCATSCGSFSLLCSMEDEEDLLVQSSG